MLIDSLHTILVGTEVLAGYLSGGTGTGSVGQCEDAGRWVWARSLRPRPLTLRRSLAGAEDVV